jgi:HD-GYP domain-containing protein (c-di-GMP phosphodiesterase class II)
MANMIANKSLSSVHEDTLMIENDASDHADPLNIKIIMKNVESLQTIFGRMGFTTQVAKISKGIGIMLSMAKGDLDLLYKSALVYDFGYLMLDKDKLQGIMLKTNISDEEFDFIKTHTNKGIDFFGDIELPEEMKKGILYHHERNDGSGYPEGLIGTDIPLFAKIIGLSETFVAMTTYRPHKEKFSGDAALAVIRDGARKKFDPEHINALTEFLTKSGIVKR